MFSRFTVLLVACSAVSAGQLDDKRILEQKESTNFCLDKQAELDNEQLARKHPHDKELIKLVALRAGLCYLVGREIVDLDSAIEIFDAEREKEIMRRIQEEQTTNREQGA